MHIIVTSETKTKACDHFYLTTPNQFIMADCMDCFLSCSSNASHQPKSDEIRAWSQGLPRLLESRYGTALFRAFLQREHAEENLDFILKVDKYKNTENLQKRQRLAWDLYREYIAVGAKHELNLDSMSRKVTTLAMITPHLTTFDTAKARIMNLLSNDAYMRFLNWNIYKDLALKEITKEGIEMTETEIEAEKKSASHSGLEPSSQSMIPMREFKS